MFEKKLKVIVVVININALLVIVLIKKKFFSPTSHSKNISPFPTPLCNPAHFPSPYDLFILCSPSEQKQVYRVITQTWHSKMQ